MARKKVFRVFEAGSGKRPIGLVKQAAKAPHRRRRQRKFIGVDIEKVNLNKLLKKTGAKRMPKNLEVRQQCAVKALKMLEPESQHLIFSSYLINHLALYGKADPMTNVAEFFAYAKKALKPGGRLILVQDRASISVVEEQAKGFGLKLFKKPLPDEKAAKSPAKFIRLRSTPKKRLVMLDRAIDIDPAIALSIGIIMKAVKVSKPDQLFEPTIFIMQKPKKNKGKVELVTRLNAELETDPAIRAALKEILG